MRSPWLKVGLMLVIANTLQPCWAGELAGRLERVDLKTVTLRGDNNKLLVVHVDVNHRQQAAPFLGKRVTVEFLNEQGAIRATSFRCPNSR